MSDESTAMAARPPQVGSTAVYDDQRAFELAKQWAQMFAKSELVPKHMRGKPADCLIGFAIARQMGEDPLTVLQNMYVVHGQPGWKTQFLIARANAHGPFRGPITWDVDGADPKSLRVTAKATLEATGEVVTASADMAMARAEGWDKNPKYKSMPEHMLRWRSAAFLIRLYCPEVTFGMQTAEELRDMAPRQLEGEVHPLEVAMAAEDAEVVDDDVPLSTDEVEQ